MGLKLLKRKMSFRRLRILSLLLVTVMMVSLLAGITANAEYVEYKAPMTMVKAFDLDSIVFDQEGGLANQVDVTYTITPEPISVDDVYIEPVAKEVVIIIDKSGSMAWDASSDSDGTSRMSLVRSAAVDFVERLSKEDNISIGLVEYADVASIYTKDGYTLIPTFANSTVNKLKNHIKKIEASGGTNMGDALRRAKEILDSGNSEAQQYIVFMTDGEPTAFSISDGSYIPYESNYNPPQTAIGKIVTGEDVYYDQATSITIQDNQFYTSTGAPDYAFVNYSPEYTGLSGDFAGYAEKYARMYSIAINETTTGFKNYYISFSSDDAKNKLSTLALYSGATTKDASSGEGIEAIYNAIATEITATLLLEDVSFEETIAPEFSVVSYPSDMNLIGQVLTKSYEDVVYRLNEDETYYIAEPIFFEITVEALQLGELTLGANNSSGFHFIDLDGTIRHDFFEPVTLMVNEFGLMSDHLKVLELQPTRNFELSRGALQAEFPDVDITLEQLSMSEFIGRVDEINGQYDIVYIGAKESYKDRVFTSNAQGNIKEDIDITNKKAQQILEFANAGQLFIFDEDILAYSGSKLKTNFTNVSSLDHVYEVPSANSDFFDNIYGWYLSSNKRPELTINSEPKTYDGSDSSYLPDHRINYLYDAYSYSEGNMTTILYLDVNGDGLFTANEIAKDHYISQSVNGLSMYVNYEDSFNGCMPWKLVLKDNLTGSKSFETGFMAMKGDKTVVNVLNLIPKSGSLDFYSAEFDPMLSTEDYEINITRMDVDVFESNYPNPVNGDSTLLNGYYDMIIFGFGDSYMNRDITKDDVLLAIHDFIATGQSVMFTHDLAGPADATVHDGISFYNDAPSITANFKTDMGFSDSRTYAGSASGNWKAKTTSSAYKQNDGLITMYPYILAPGTEKTLAISPTHDQYWKIDLESDTVVPWFNLNNGTLKYYPEAYYYTFSNGTITYSGTGHSDPKVEAEQELFVNTMLKASRGANHAPIIEVEDLYDEMNVLPSELLLPFKIKVTDPDATDQDFHTEFTIIVDGVERLVLEKDDLEKGVLTDIELLKELDETVREFILKITATDTGGAVAIEEFNLTHVEVPMLKVDDDASIGYLVGDMIDLQFMIGVEGDQEAQKQLVTNINLVATVNNTYLTVGALDYDGFVKVGSTYTMNPMFDIEATTSIDEADEERTLTMEAIKKGNVVMPLIGTYDRRFSVDQVDPEVIDYYSEVPFGIQEGAINVIVNDNIGRVIGNVGVEIYNSDGVKVADGITEELTGSVKIPSLTTDIYTVKLVNLPPEFALDIISEQIIDLKYDTDPGDGIKTNDQDVEFTINDIIPPEVEYSYMIDGLVVRDNPGAANTNGVTIHLHFDGVNSPLEVFGVKKVANINDPSPAAVASTYESSAAPEITLEADDAPVHNWRDPANNPADPGYSSLDPDTEQGQETLNKFEVVENGVYAVYAKNKSGNTVIVLIKIAFFVDKVPDIL